MPKSATRTFSEAAANTAKVSVVIRTPVTMVTITDVWRGRSPNRDSFFLPTFEPTRSPMTAIAPPVTISAAIRTIPYISPCTPSFVKFRLSNHLITSTPAG